LLAQSVSLDQRALEITQNQLKSGTASSGDPASAQQAADVALNEFNAGTVIYTTVITNIEALLADQESLLTIRQNQLVAVVTLVEALGGGWDTSRL
jgi:outer membrane protein TolC